MSSATMGDQYRVIDVVAVFSGAGEDGAVAAVKSMEGVIERGGRAC